MNVKTQLSEIAMQNSLGADAMQFPEYYWDGIRVFPSYIMTEKNLLIEPFKRDTIAEDIRRMMEVIK